MDFFKQNIIPAEVFIQLVAFLCVFFTLKKLAWKPVQESLENRSKRIREEFEHIEKTKQELETLKSDYAVKLQKIEDEARVKIQQTIEEGRRIAKEIQDKARSEAQESFEKSKEHLAVEVAKARITLKQEIADLSLQVAEKVIGEKMTAELQQQKALQIIEELEKL